MNADGATAGSVLRLLKLRRVVTQLSRSVDFYADSLGFRPVESGMRDGGRGGVPPAWSRALLSLGDQLIELVSPPPADRIGAAWDAAAFSALGAGFQHAAIVCADIDAALDRLLRTGLPHAISRGAGAVRLADSAGGVTAYKFTDPDGHPLELIALPAGQGDARWQRDAVATGAVDAPTLGIDHSAVVVTDAARSIAFYRDALGFELTAQQVNQGAAQDRLDGADGVVVDVVALAPAGAATPHLELLGYRQPTPAPAAATVAAHPEWADCLCWQVDDLDAVSARLAAIGWPSTRPSPGATALRDPDGHRLELSA